MIRGGQGDDRIYGRATTGTSAGAEWEYLYGDEGNDYIFGEDDALTAYLFGGEGHDHIYGGDRDTGSNNTGGHSYMWGDAGEDVIHFGKDAYYGIYQYAYGGKGDDVINPDIDEAVLKILK